MTIKPRLGLLAGGLVASIAIAGCQPVVAQAPFHARPDTVELGELRGPFDGQVVDGGSGKPVEGATVVVSWALRAGRGLSGPSRTEVASVDTDADGRYRVPRLETRIEVRESLERVTLVIYKKGYVGWRSDRRFSDLSPRFDFAQTHNVARLDRQPADLSHVRHLAYLGASGPLLTKVSWELPLAAEELQPTAESAPSAAEAAESATHLDARVLLSPEELKAVSGWSGRFTTEPLPDLPSTPTYDSVHFKAEGQPEKFDAAIRVWKLSPEAAFAKFEEQRKELPDAEESKDVGHRSFRSTEGDLLAVGGLDQSLGVVVVFTCGRGLCADHAQAAALMRRMWGRLGRMGQSKTLHVEPPAVAEPAAATAEPAQSPEPAHAPLPAPEPAQPPEPVGAPMRANPPPSAVAPVTRGPGVRRGKRLRGKGKAGFRRRVKGAGKIGGAGKVGAAGKVKLKGKGARRRRKP